MKANRVTRITLKSPALAKGSSRKLTSTKIKPNIRPTTGKKIADRPTSSVDCCIQPGRGKRVKNCRAAKKSFTAVFSLHRRNRRSPFHREVLPRPLSSPLVYTPRCLRQGAFLDSERAAASELRVTRHGRFPRIDGRQKESRGREDKDAERAALRRLI